MQITPNAPQKFTNIGSLTVKQIKKYPLIVTDGSPLISNNTYARIKLNNKVCYMIRDQRFGYDNIKIYKRNSSNSQNYININDLGDDDIIEFHIHFELLSFSYMRINNIKTNISTKEKYFKIISVSIMDICNFLYKDISEYVKMQTIPTQKKFPKILEEIKQNNQDFEFYPTSKEVIKELYKNMKRDTKLVGNRYYSDKSVSFMDVGAGNGKIFKELEMLAKKDDKKLFSSKYAIEKSDILSEQIPEDVFVIGSDFEHQTFLDKNIDMVYSNPPYSNFANWSVKLIKELSSYFIYLLVPKRWKENKDIADALEFRGASAKTVYSYDFRNSEDRKARTEVELIRVNFNKGEYVKATQDPFNLWFNETFKIKIDSKDDTLLNQFKKEQKNKTDDNNSELVKGGDLTETLVKLYDKELNKIMTNYKALSSLDASLFEEMKIKLPDLIEGMKLKIKGLKKVYWMEIFNNLKGISKRLTSKSRTELFNKLTQNNNIDFTTSNIKNVLIYVLKNASKYFDTQLTNVYRDLTNKDNINLYKSNKQFIKDDYRYLKDELNKYSLDYRTVQHNKGGIYSDYGDNYRNYLDDRASNFLKDLIVISENLGFKIDANLDNINFKLQTKHNIYFKPVHPLNVGDITNLGKIKEVFLLNDGLYQYDIDNSFYHQNLIKKDIFMELKFFMNGNIHIKFNKKFMRTFNIEMARINKWVKSPKEASEEFNISEEEAKKIFNTNLSISNLSLKTDNLIGFVETKKESKPIEVEKVIVEPATNFSEKETKTDTNLKRILAIKSKQKRIILNDNPKRIGFLFNYYNSRDIELDIMENLSAAGWEILGFHENQSDSMTDYYHPASWDGIALKDGFKILVNIGYAKNNNNHGSKNVNIDYSKIKKLEAILNCPSSSDGEKENAKRAIERLNIGTPVEQTQIKSIVHKANPTNKKWHIEDDNGVIVASGSNLGRLEAKANYYHKNFKEFLRTFNDYGRVEITEEILEDALNKYFKNEFLKIEDRKFMNDFINKVNSYAVVKIGEETEKTIKYFEEIKKDIYHFTKTEIIPTEESLKVGDVLAGGGKYKVFANNEFITSDSLFIVEKVAEHGIVGFFAPYDRATRTRKIIKRKGTKPRYFMKSSLKNLVLVDVKKEVLITKKEKFKIVKIKKETKQTKEPNRATTARNSNKDVDVTEFEKIANNGTISNFTHTKTKEVLKVLKLKDKLSKDVFIEFSKWFKDEKRGFYSRFAKGFILSKEIEPEGNINVNVNFYSEPCEVAEPQKVIVNDPRNFLPKLLENNTFYTVKDEKTKIKLDNLSKNILADSNYYLSPDDVSIYLMLFISAFINNNFIAQIECFGLIENNSNSFSRKLFSYITGVPLKDFKTGFLLNELFKSRFSRVYNYIKALKHNDYTIIKNKELEIKNKYALEFKEYFKSDIFNINYIKSLSSMELGRLKKSLNKEYRYDGAVMSVKQNLEIKEYTQKRMMKKDFNHKYYEKIGDYGYCESYEQKQYSINIKKKREYFITDNKSFMEIPKIIFNALNFIDITNINDFEEPTQIELENYNIINIYDILSLDINSDIKIPKEQIVTSATNFLENEIKIDSIYKIGDILMSGKITDNNSNDIVDDEKSIGYQKKAILKDVSIKYFKDSNNKLVGISLKSDNMDDKRLFDIRQYKEIENTNKSLISMSEPILVTGGFDSNIKGFKKLRAEHTNHKKSISKLNSKIATKIKQIEAQSTKDNDSFSSLGFGHGMRCSKYPTFSKTFNLEAKLNDYKKELSSLISTVRIYKSSKYSADEDINLISDLSFEMYSATFKFNNKEKAKELIKSVLKIRIPDSADGSYYSYAELSLILRTHKNIINKSFCSEQIKENKATAHTNNKSHTDTTNIKTDGLNQRYRDTHTIEKPLNHSGNLKDVNYHSLEKQDTS